MFSKTLLLSCCRLTLVLYHTTWSSFLYLLLIIVLRQGLLYFIDHPTLLLLFLIPCFIFWRALTQLIFYNFVLLGDFNVNFDNISHPLYLRLNSIAQFFSFSQVVSGHTHIASPGTSSLIDLVFLSSPEHFQECSVIPPIANSDDSGIMLSVHWTAKKARPPATQQKGLVLCTS